MTEQVLTTSCKLKVNEVLAQEIDATLQGFADLCATQINSTVDPKVTGRLAIHKETHFCKQTFELPANLVCQAISEFLVIMKLRALKTVRSRNSSQPARRIRCANI